MAGTNVAIVDGGGANIASLEYALQRLGARGQLTTNANVIRNASHVILPGVGAAAPAMARLTDAALADVVRELEQPVLGVCLGMQLLAAHSDEDDTACIGVFDAAAGRLAGGPENPVPNMGWCRIQRTGAHSLLDGIEDGSWFYFVHSYALPPGADTIATADHGEPFSAVIARNNFHAVQFHPERSSQSGSKLLANFLAMTA